MQRGPRLVLGQRRRSTGEAQGIADHRDRRDRHGDGGDERRRQAEDGDRNGERIVARRKHQILPHQALGAAGNCDRLGHRPQVVAQEDEIGGRAPDIERWTQTGVKGELAEREIRSYGLPESDHYPSEDPGFGVYLFRDKWGLAHNARNYQMQRTYAEVATKVSADPAGIGITTLNRVTPDVKVVGVTSSEWGRPMHGTRDEVQTGNYPYDRAL